VKASTGILFIALTTFTFAADPADAVREAAEGWTQAAVKQDTAGLRRFLADDLQYAHAGGQLQTRDQYIAAVTKGPARYESFTFSDLKVRFYGKAAVLTAFVDVKMAGQDSFRVRTLQVYTEKQGQWQMAAHQSTRLTPPRQGQGRGQAQGQAGQAQGR
jgi:ketosteroid isomerase-like protein